MEPTLTSLLHSKLEWIFVGGKGGVGKTTTSCALATLFASTPMRDPTAPGGSRARRVLLISTDPAHNLSDAFNQRFGPQPTPVAGLDGALSAMEVDPAKFTHGTLIGSLAGDSGTPCAKASASVPTVEEGKQPTELPSAPANTGSPENVSVNLFSRLGVVLKEAARTMPGIDEISVFAEIIHYVQSLAFDVLIFDTAPTGHTLRLLALPQMLNTTVERLMSLEGLGPLIEAASHFLTSTHGIHDRDGGTMSASAGGTAASLPASSTPTPPASSSSSLPGGDSASHVLGRQWGFDQAELHMQLHRWREMMQEVQARFNDPDRTTFVCVCIAEFLSVYETERLVQELMKYDIDCEHIVVNQLLLKPSSEPPCRMCAARVKMQSKYMEQIDLLYEDFHVVRMPLLSDEVRGVAALRTFARFLQEPFDPDRHGYIEVDAPC